MTLDLVIKRDESPVNDIKGQSRLAYQWRNGLRRRLRVGLSDGIPVGLQMGFLVG